MASDAPTRTPERQAFYDKIAPANLAPLWEQLHSLVTPEPVPKCLPAIWHYRDVRPHLMQSGSLITAQEATRRVLMLMNPGLDGQASITGSLFAALYHRGARRLHRGRWRAHRDGAGRFRDHPIVDLARPRQ
jgi:gentisate 1,2-dioxygenase